MSNFSEVYKWYLSGYCDASSLFGAKPSERLCQALALGVHHRTTSKPPLMSSVAVTAELRAMAPKVTLFGPTVAVQSAFDVVLTSVANSVWTIKAIRDLTNLGLREAKDLVDGVRVSASHKVVLAAIPKDRAEAAAKLLRDAGCTVEVS